MTSVNVPPTRRPHLSSNKEINTSTGTTSAATHLKGSYDIFSKTNTCFTVSNIPGIRRCILTPTLYAITPLSVCPALSVTLVYCGQTVGRIKVKLGMQAGLGPGHIVRWGPSSPLRKGGGTPNFRPVSVVAKWLDGLRCHFVWK